MHIRTRGHCFRGTSAVVVCEGDQLDVVEGRTQLGNLICWGAGEYESMRFWQVPVLITCFTFTAFSLFSARQVVRPRYEGLATVIIVIKPAHFTSSRNGLRHRGWSVKDFRFFKRYQAQTRSVSSPSASIDMSHAHSLLFGFRWSPACQVQSDLLLV
jgi:hypothetical protein